MGRYLKYPVLIVIEYDCRGKRTRREFNAHSSAKSFWVAKDRAGKNPKIIGERGNHA